MKNKKMNAASNNSSKQQQPASRLTDDRAEKGLGSKQSSTQTSTDAFQPKKVQQPTSSQSGAAVKSKINK